MLQVFPDEFHLVTLKILLETCGSLQEKVNVKNIIISLIDRLAMFATRSETGVPKDIPLFTIFSEQISMIIKVMKDAISLEFQEARLEVLRKSSIYTLVKCGP